MRERLAVDIGGTFIDAITIDVDTGETDLAKVPTTPKNPAEGVIDAIRKGGTEMDGINRFIHGTTLGVNALIEREGANVGIITNEGFRDIFEMGRYDVPDEDLYNFTYDKPAPLVSRRKRLGVPARIDVNGEVVEPLDSDALVAAAEELVEEHGVESIAVCFLHAYRNPAHEQEAAELIQERYPAISISISSDIVKEHYEYERTSTTVLDAYIKPIFDSYVSELDDRLTGLGFDGSLLITRSGGGALPAESAKNTPVHTVMSGPAGGLIGASQVSAITGIDNLITMDMGGTSLETCVIENGTPSVAYESSLEHLPMMIPVFDIRTIGAGGGSIAWHDEHLLKVGPRSAGATPGPICYGRGGTEPTVTDAAVQLGFMQPDAFLGGEMELDISNIRDGIKQHVADPLGLSLTNASKGILDVIINKQVSAIREVTVEKGLDPRDFSLLAFGGAGPMLAPLVARELGVNKIVIPEVPSVFSAWGMLMSDVMYDFSHTYLTALEDIAIEDINENYEMLEQQAIDALSEDGYPRDTQRLSRSIEMRYRGQAHTVEIEGSGIESMSQIEDRFNTQHQARYGHNLDDQPELVYLRVRGIGMNDTPTIKRRDEQTAPEPEARETTEMYCFTRDERLPVNVFERGELSRGHQIDGPAIVQEPTSTTVIHSGQQISVDEYGHLIINGGHA